MISQSYIVILATERATVDWIVYSAFQYHSWSTSCCLCNITRLPNRCSADLIHNIYFPFKVNIVTCYEKFIVAQLSPRALDNEVKTIDWMRLWAIYDNNHPLVDRFRLSGGTSLISAWYSAPGEPTLKGKQQTQNPWVQTDRISQALNHTEMI